jgi:hypothetical protein
MALILPLVENSSTLLELASRKVSQDFPSNPRSVPVLLGVQISQKPPTDEVERFLSMLEFDSGGKSYCWGRYVTVKAGTTSIEWFESVF